MFHMRQENNEESGNVTSFKCIRFGGGVTPLDVILILVWARSQKYIECRFEMEGKDELEREESIIGNHDIQPPLARLKTGCPVFLGPWPPTYVVVAH